MSPIGQLYLHGFEKSDTLSPVEICAGNVLESIRIWYKYIMICLQVLQLKQTYPQKSVEIMRPYTNKYATMANAAVIKSDPATGIWKIEMLIKI